MSGGGAECRVCGDRASGRHYGVASCDGCRGFFKRSVRRGLQYACKERGCCVVDVARRNQCQACRLAKCLAVRMRKEAVQHERAARSQPRRRTRAPCCAAPLCGGGGVERRCRGGGDAATHNVDLKDPSEPPVGDSGGEGAASPALRPGILPPPDPVDAAQEAAARLLFLCVRWVRGVPPFLQLGARDQAVLLEEAWSDVFVLSAAQWGFPLQEGFLSLSSLTCPEKRPLVACQLHQMKSIMSQLASQQVDHTEFSCLKALALFRPEAGGLSDAARVEQLQDQTQLMLHEYVLTRQPPSRVRFGKLLLALALARRVSACVLEDMFFRKTIGAVPVGRLLCDMLRAA